MDKEFLESQRKKLEEEKKEVEQELQDVTEKGKTKVSDKLRAKFPQLGEDEDENAEEVEEYIENLDLEGHLEDLLRDINDALIRIKENKYGICEKCGKKISKARLEAFPAASLCIEDQNKEEKGNHFL